MTPPMAAYDVAGEGKSTDPTNSALASVVPKNSGRNADDTITLLIEFIALTALAMGIAVSDRMTKAEKVK